ncbi:hypothetical protein ACFL9U_06150 [Thermodesulfobacteriota bacterium]
MFLAERPMYWVANGFNNSIHNFINKLREKNQTDQQQEQASDAISLYYETGTTQSGEKVPFKNKNAIISTKKEDLKSKNANWKPVYDDLNAEIKMRHYSPKTLKAYTGPKSKDPQMLSAADVKDFRFISTRFRAGRSKRRKVRLISPDFIN